MFSPITLTQLSQIIAVISPPQCDTPQKVQVIGITTDTRTLQPNQAFVALRGERFDGHQFVEQAIAQGAACAIVDSNFTPDRTDLPLLTVRDTLAAYQAIARWWREQCQIPVIGVTGSVGKTTTKELIAAVLKTQGNVHKTQANYNNEIGVPKTLLQLTLDHDFAVIEMAMRARGEIALLTQITRPTIGLITNVGTAHIGRLGSEQAIAEAKCELLAEMPETSVAILNHDNRRLIDTAATVWQGKTFTYGLEGGDLQGELINPQTLRVAGLDLPLPLPGYHNASNFLAALAVLKVIQGENLGENSSDEKILAPFQEGLSVQLPEGRAKRYDLPNDIIILDETYNAGLESMIAALDLLRQTPGQRHIAVLGTMKELGERSREFHQKVGKKAYDLNLDALFILADAEEAEAMATGAKGLSVLEVHKMESDNIHQQVAEQLTEFIRPGDRILFKASHSVQLNRVVEKVQDALME
ncbi:MAG: UDP-N-acetylmuramoyl-tripeptide--D-alanyl-D-alanine ligase [Cyanobacteria bacterium J06592_8]